MSSIFQQDISEQIWFDNYKWETDKDVFDTFRRTAKHVASIEKDKQYWEEKYFELLSKFKYIPAGRILSNAGTSLKKTTFINCFASGFQGKNLDSIDGIYRELSRQAKILSSEGGYGCNFDVLRPRGSFVSGIGVETSGVVEFMKVWDASSDALTRGSGFKKKEDKGKNKIRKGAMMSMLSCWHPAIEEFITAKQQPGVLTKFNLSVLITDEFMSCRKHHKPWQLIFPDTSCEKYEDEWDGNIKKWKEKGYPINIWKEYKDANELWNTIINLTYTRNEPGIAFIDRVNQLNNLAYCEIINASNPCGEQFLPINGSCNLGSINLAQYIVKEHLDIDVLIEDIPTIVRFQDAITDLTNFPLPEQKKEAISKRRAGIGYMGYGTALYMMKIPYGSKKALKFTEMLCSTVTNGIYQASSLLAKEKGSFPAYDTDRYLESKFVKQALTKDTIDLIRHYGIRNSHLTTVAPTGNTGIFANNVSGGLEPVISPKYTRTITINVPPDELTLPTSIDWDHQKYESPNGWEWVMEGDEFILRKEAEVNGKLTIFKIDRNRGLCREETVYDYSVLALGEEFWKDEASAKENKEEFYGKTLFDLSIEDHLNTMAIFAKYVDSSISKTINVPNNYPYEDFKKVYDFAYDTGYIKGVTTYRMGTTASVISIKTDGNKIVERSAPERPKALPCQIQRITVKGEKWIVFVGLYKGHPYEVFSGKVDLVDIPSSITEGMIVKVDRGRYSFESSGEVLVKDIGRIFCNDDNEAKTRLISTALRHGVPIGFVVDQLSKSKGVITEFSKSIIRALKKYVPEGAESSDICPNCGEKLVFVEGCQQCKNCGIAKCG